MKKMLILDVAHSYGHKKFNYFYIKHIATFCNLVIINDGKYYNDLQLDNVKLLNFHQSMNDRGGLLNRLNIIKTYRKIAESRIIDQVDAVLVMGYDTLTFPFFYLLCKPQNSVFVIQHHNIDENYNWLKRCAFNFFKNKVVHIVLDKSFIHMLRNKWSVKGKIEYLPHYLSKLGYCEKCSNEDYIIALSNSNDEKKVEHLVEMDRLGLLNGCNGKFIVKSKTLQYESERLKVIKGYISDEEYSSYFRDAKATLIFFPSNYDIRFSCTLIEAIINYKIVIGCSIPFVHEYALRYPNNVMEYSNDKELLNLLENLKNTSFSLIERESLINELSEEKIMLALRSIFNMFDF